MKDPGSLGSATADATKKESTTALLRMVGSISVDASGWCMGKVGIEKTSL